MSQPDFSLFVSSVEGKTVYRFGTRQLIGAKKKHVPPLQPNESPADRPAITVWSTERIVAITAAEHAKYLKEYTREIRDGSLKVRTREEWEAQNAAFASAADAARKAAEQAKAEADKAAKDAAQTSEN